ncbi:hypothetical protein M440DRAFT_1450392, partial [Trichoderma longibrachiatum ATCC 18648]
SRLPAAPSYQDVARRWILAFERNRAAPGLRHARFRTVGSITHVRRHHEPARNQSESFCTRVLIRQDPSKSALCSSNSSQPRIVPFRAGLTEKQTEILTQPLLPNDRPKDRPGHRDRREMQLPHRGPSPNVHMLLSCSNPTSPALVGSPSGLCTREAHLVLPIGGLGSVC